MSVNLFASLLRHAESSAGFHDLAGVVRRGPEWRKDDVWRLVVHRARQDQTWVVVAAGLAAPGLRAVIRRWDQRGVDRDELAAEAVSAFANALHHLDPAGPHVCSRLVYAADKAARRTVYRYRRDRQRQAILRQEPAAAAGSGSPEDVLAQAAAEGVLTSMEAELIAGSRLEDRSLRSVAAAVDVAYSTAKRRRARAEARLVAWIEERQKNPDAG